jgi:hypothetical protein
VRVGENGYGVFVRLVIVSAVLWMVVTGPVLVGCGGRSSAQFDSGAWKQPIGYCVPSARQRMARAAASVAEAARGRAQVRRVLGSPESIANGDWYYYVGANNNGFLPECVLLHVRFAEQHPIAIIETDS